MSLFKPLNIICWPSKKVRKKGQFWRAAENSYNSSCNFLLLWHICLNCEPPVFTWLKFKSQPQDYETFFQYHLRWCHPYLFPWYVCLNFEPPGFQKNFLQWIPNYNIYYKGIFPYLEITKNLMYTKHFNIIITMTPLAP